MINLPIEYIKNDKIIYRLDNISPINKIPTYVISLFKNPLVTEDNYRPNVVRQSTRLIYSLDNKLYKMINVHLDPDVPRDSPTLDFKLERIITSDEKIVLYNKVFMSIIKYRIDEINIKGIKQYIIVNNKYPINILKNYIITYYKNQKPIVICDTDGKETSRLLIDADNDSSFMLFVIPSSKYTNKILYTKRYNSDMNNKDINLLENLYIYSNKQEKYISEKYITPDYTSYLTNLKNIFQKFNNPSQTIQQTKEFSDFISQILNIMQIINK